MKKIRHWIYLSLKNIVKRLQAFIAWSPNQVISYSQEGEDIFLSRFFDNKNKGFFVDIGAHHPTRFSNTYRLYRHGWRGINIDAMPGSMSIFNKKRPLDTNIEIAIGSSNGEGLYHHFSEAALNGFNSKLSNNRQEIQGKKILKSEKLLMKKLDEVLDLNMKPGQKIDFFNIDVEGFELEVLESNDWTKYRPTLIITEILNSDEENNHVFKYLESKGYKFYGKAVYSFYFIDSLDKES